jgi:hypothetical protein
MTDYKNRAVGKSKGMDMLLTDRMIGQKKLNVQVW